MSAFGGKADMTQTGKVAGFGGLDVIDLADIGFRRPYDDRL
jgi:hypothetical protein